MDVANIDSNYLWSAVLLATTHLCQQFWLISIEELSTSWGKSYDVALEINHFNFFAETVKNATDYLLGDNIHCPRIP
jgi:hypothetical protein